MLPYWLPEVHPKFKLHLFAIHATNNEAQALDNVDGRMEQRRNSDPLVASPLQTGTVNKNAFWLTSNSWVYSKGQQRKEHLTLDVIKENWIL